jgi:type IV pilus assembly protein PilQ
VLGGIFQQTSSDGVSKVPLFGDLPVVGALFRNSSQLQQKRELLIFVTPKIVTERP